MWADGDGDALNERRVDLPAVCGQHVLDPSQGAEHHAEAHTDQASAPILCDHLRIEPRGRFSRKFRF